HEMRLRNALGQVAKEGREMGSDARLLVSLAQLIEIFLARLLHDGEALAHLRRQELKRGRESLREEMCALASAEDEKEEARAWSGWSVGGIAIAKYCVAYRNAGQPRLSFGVGAKQLGRLERQRNLVDEARQQPVGAAHDRVLLVDCGRDFQRVRG